MIPFIQKAQYSKIHRHRKQISGCLGLEERGMGNDCLVGTGLLFWGDAYVLKLDYGRNGTTL